MPSNDVIFYECMNNKSRRMSREFSRRVVIIFAYILVDTISRMTGWFLEHIMRVRLTRQDETPQMSHTRNKKSLLMRNPVASQESAQNENWHDRRMAEELELLKRRLEAEYVTAYGPLHYYFVVCADTKLHYCCAGSASQCGRRRDLAH
jgi:hypothetical protein